MILSTEIIFLPAEKLYQLLLPGQVTDLLSLKGPDGAYLPIKHEHKMQLEWLSHKIITRLTALDEVQTVTRKRLQVKKRAAAIILIGCVAAAFFSTGVAGLIRVNKLYVLMSAFTLGIISGLQLLKYFALGINSPDGDLASDPEVLTLKELIIKDYSVTPG